MVSSSLPVIFRDSLHVAHFQVALKSHKQPFDAFLPWFSSDVSSVSIRYESGRFTYLEILEFSNECFLQPSCIICRYSPRYHSKFGKWQLSSVPFCISLTCVDYITLKKELIYRIFSLNFCILLQWLPS